MTGFWGVLKSGLELVLRALDGAGMRGPRWEWRKRTWRAALEGRAAEAKARRQDDARRSRLCPACRTLVSADSSICYECGGSMRSPAGIQRVKGAVEKITGGPIQDRYVLKPLRY